MANGSRLDNELNIFLHIGHFKTGTSTFQHLLSGSRELLAEHGILYPDIGGRFPWQHGDILSPATHKGEYSALETLIFDTKKKGFKTIILSGEVASNCRPAQAKEMTRRLRKLGNLEVFYVVRHWQSYLPSRYYQNIKRGDGWNWYSFIETCGRDFGINVDINYGLVANAYSEADRLHLEPYQGNTSARLLQLMKIGFLRDSNMKSNESKTFEEVEVLRLSNILVQRHLGVEHNLHYNNLKNGTLANPGFELLELRKMVYMKPKIQEKLLEIVRKTQLLIPLEEFDFSIWERALMGSAEFRKFDFDLWKLGPPNNFRVATASFENNLMLRQTHESGVFL